MDILLQVSVEVGAGGAGSTCCAGAGGYTGGAGDSCNIVCYNGLSGASVDGTALGGGGYYQGGIGISAENNLNRATVALGGFSNQGFWFYEEEPKEGWGIGLTEQSGNGGAAGEGGNIRVSSNAKIYAFNGNIYTDSLEEHAYDNGINQAPIYAQAGIIVEKYDYDVSNIEGQMIDVSNFFKLKLIASQKKVMPLTYSNEIYLKDSKYISNKIININTKLGITTNTLLTAVDMSKQGIGSGAGYIEISNGSYTIDASLN